MKHVVYACNDNYIEQTTISIVSLLKHNDDSFRIWIVSDQITEANRQLIIEKTADYPGEIIFLELEEVLKDVDIQRGERHPRTIYAKLFLETIIDADRLLYLDSDTVVCGSLQALWSMDLDNILAAGVQMPYSAEMKSRMNIQSDAPYLCDGVVLLNLELWRERKIGDKCRAYISRHGGNPPMMSEGTLNYVCQGYIDVLEPIYNLMPQMLFYKAWQIKKLFKAEYDYQEKQLEQARKCPLIVHYIKELYNRPWYEPCNHPFKKLYRDECKSIFGRESFENNDIALHTKITKKLYQVLPFSVYVWLYQVKHLIKR